MLDCLEIHEINELVFCIKYIETFQLDAVDKTRMNVVYKLYTEYKTQVQRITELENRLKQVTNDVF